MYVEKSEKEKKKKEKEKKKEAEQIVLKLKVASHTHPAIQEVVERGLVHHVGPMGRIVERFLFFLPVESIFEKKFSLLLLS